LVEKKSFNFFFKEIFEGNKLVWQDQSTLVLLKNQKPILQISVVQII